MANPERSVPMQHSRDQWLSTKDGAVTLKTGDARHAYAVGFVDGQKRGVMLSAQTDRVSADTMAEVKKLAGLSPVAALLYVSTDETLPIHARKDELLADINDDLGTAYKRQHIDNWLAGRKTTPQRVQSIARRDVLRYLFGDDVADSLIGLA